MLHSVVGDIEPNRIFWLSVYFSVFDFCAFIFIFGYLFLLHYLYWIRIKFSATSNNPKRSGFLECTECSERTSREKENEQCINECRLYVNHVVAPWLVNMHKSFSFLYSICSHRMVLGATLGSKIRCMERINKWTRHHNECEKRWNLFLDFLLFSHSVTGFCLIICTIFDTSFTD